MRFDTIALLRCPAGCAGELAVTATETRGDCLRNGTLTCPVCEQCYPVEEGIARMLPGFLANADPAPHTAADAIEIERKRSEMAARDAQVEDYDQMRGLALFGKFWEIPSTLAELNPGPGDVLLEAGCGTGRMTPAFAGRVRTLVSVDFSLESLHVCQRKLEAAGITNVDLIQADICALPFRDDRFDKVVSCGVLEHVPTVESRARMIAELARVAKIGSDVVISAYKHNLYTRLFGQKEGAHAGGIYFFRYDLPELHAALARSLEVQRISGKLVYYFLAHGRKSGTNARSAALMTDTQSPHTSDETPLLPARPEKKATLRFGQREMHRLTLLVILLIAIPLCYGLYRVFLNFRSHRDVIVGESNLQALWKAMKGYSEDWDGTLPPANSWTDAVGGYLSSSPSLPGGKLSALQGPSDLGPVHYVYNDLVAGFNLERPDTHKYVNPSRMVVLIERPGAPDNAHVSIPSQDSAQGEAALAKLLSFPHYADDPNGATTLVLFADGHPDRIQRIDLQKSRLQSQE
jgi:ubiquinone/menaquinone biosynthesis C-methylase UbiE/uncharacterized protein YbaR (Trm112 family)